MSATSAEVRLLPASFQGRFAQVAQADEAPVAWLETDLDENLRYSPGLVVLTDRRLIDLTIPQSNGTPKIAEPQTWPVNRAITLRAEEHGGAGQLALFSGNMRIARWRYTLGQAGAAHRLARRLAALARPYSA